MAYTTAAAREGLLDTVADAIDAIGLALAELGEAYEQLDEPTAETLERELFRPMQLAYGRAKRTYAAFAERHGLIGRTFEPIIPGAPARGVKGFLDRAVECAAEADSLIVALQDSMLPVEVGDAELRAGLEEVRMLLAGLSGRAQQLVRTFGR
jgi:hypothetical protein